MDRSAGCSRGIARKAEPTGRQRLGEQRGQSRFEKRRLGRRESSDFGWVALDSDYVMAELYHAGGMNRPEIAAASH